MANPNHPAKGSEVKVEPIRDPKSISTIKKLLAGNPRNLALFTLGINTNLRASDLIKITVGQVRHLKAGDELTLKEKKTGKPRRITLNKSAVGVIQSLLSSQALGDHEPLFRSQRGEALTVGSVHRLVKTWCRDIGLFGNYGSHTLRKTFGFHARQAGVDIPTLMELFNHSSQRQTLAYLGVQPEELKDAYMKLEL